MKEHTEGIVLVLCAGFLYALTGTISKSLYHSGLEVLAILSLRYTVAAIFFGLVLWNRGRSLFYLIRKDWPAVTLLAACLFVNTLGYNFSMKFLDLSIAVVLLYSYPVMVAVASVVIFRRHLSAKMIIALFLTCSGILLILNVFEADAGNISLAGIVLVLAGALGAAAYAFAAKKLMITYHPLTVNFYVFLLNAVWVTICLFMTGAGGAMSLWNLMLILVTGCFVAGAYFCYTLGIRFLGPSKAAIICASEPAFSIVLAAVLLGETIGLGQGIGAVLIIAAITILQWQKKNPIAS